MCPTSAAADGNQLESVMKKAVWNGIIAAVGALALSTPAFAQTSATVNVNANVAAKAKLTVSAAAISFADADPDLVSQIAANTPLDITVKARTTAGSPVSLTVQAGGNLVDGSNSIAISALKWTSTGTNFSASGTSNASAGQTVVSFSGSGTTSGTQSYTLDNSWAYATGTYLTTLTYTLSAP
jgi:hypothetical protein